MIDKRLVVIQTGPNIRIVMSKEFKDEFVIVDLANGSYVAHSMTRGLDGRYNFGSVGHPLLAQRFHGVAEEVPEDNPFLADIRNIFPNARFVRVKATAIVEEV